MDALFRCDAAGPASSLPHFWEHTVGSGHATLALRADWQAQMRRAHQELGFAHVRFHGILNDDMGTLMDENDALLYSFFNADSVFDFLLQIGMKPFVELSFMPSALSSGDQIVFHYRANVTPPRDYAAWGALIARLVGHWVDRYGVAEVRTWFFEVWNEPNLSAFGTGKQADYWQLYRHTALAIKSVDPLLRVGGPATADDAWIADFLKFCGDSGLPADFVSTHHYPTDAFGRPGDDTETELSRSPRSILRERTRKARAEAGALPLYYTEWCSSSNPRDALHDEPFAAAFIVKTVLENQGLVQGYSWWTFSDIFEENYFPSEPFHGGFGLLTLHGIAKPSYRAFQLLHALGTETLALSGSHPTVDAWIARDGTDLTLMLTNFNLPRQPIETTKVTVTLDHAQRPTAATLQRIDDDHANPKRHWRADGAPEYLSAAQVAALDQSSLLIAEPQPFAFAAGRLTLQTVLPPISVAAITLVGAAAGG